MLDMGKPVPILEVAETMIRMAGKSPYTDIPIRFTGIRPGEKLHEVLHGGNEEIVALDIPKIFGLRTDVVGWPKVQAALTSLHDLSIRSGTLAESISYRFAASRAYGNILQARLQSLHEGSTAIGSSITRYLNNRVEPALATCAALEKRLGTLTDKIERAMGLLNVRIGLDLQIQNKTVLETIASTAQSQFRLQRTVEGLSVIAISYYALGVLGYVAGGPIELLGIDKTIALSVASPLIVILVWLFIRAIRRGHTS